MKRSILGALVLLVFAGTAWTADKKASKIELTEVEKQVIERVKAKDPQADPKPARNKFCSITGRLVDPTIPPVDCPQRFQHVHILVGVASQQAVEIIAAADKVNKSNKWAIPDAVVGAASTNMLLDLSESKKSVRRMLLLPAELRAPTPAPKDVAVNVVVDAGQKFQTIDGFGTATYAHNKPTHEIYAKPEFQKLVPQRDK